MTNKDSKLIKSIESLRLSEIKFIKELDKNRILIITDEYILYDTNEEKIIKKFKLTTYNEPIIIK